MKSKLGTVLSKLDGWVNNYTGFGTSRDKTAYSYFLGDYRISDAELSSMFYGNSLCAKVVETQPREMLRKGYEIEVDDDSEVGEELTEYAKNLKFNERLYDAIVWGRLFGGCLLLIGADDGQSPEMPLNEARIKSVKFLNIIDRRNLLIETYYSDPMAPRYGEPATYRVTNGLTGQLSFVHESRTLRFDGVCADLWESQKLSGWSYSVLQRVYENLRDFASVHQAAASLVSDAAQPVFKLKGLMDMIATNHELLQERMKLVDMTRSVTRSILLDSDGEDFTRVATPMAGLPEILDRFQQTVSGATGIPVSLLFGRSSAGLNATGDSEMRTFYDMIASEQKNYLEPILLRAYRIFASAKDSPTRGQVPEFEVCFNPLWEMSQLEQAQVQSTQAQADSAYIGNGVVTSEEVAMSRFGSGKYSLSTQIDTELRIQAMKAATFEDIGTNGQESQNQQEGESEVDQPAETT